MTDKSKEDANWPKDEFGRSEIFGQLWWWVIPLAGLVVAVIPALLNRSKSDNRVVVYCAQDRVYAEPVFRDFEKQTSRKVGAVYDNEAVKTVGLANRLLVERAHPRADVFWGNEEMRTRQLSAQSVFRATNGWAAFGYRSRRIVINTNRLSMTSAPHSLLELTNQTWRGKMALAYPQFGTTATHFHALRQLWGDEPWQNWCRALVANQPLLVDGNSVVVKLVAKGEALVGLTDSDDIADGQRDHLPVAACPLTQEMLLIPNTVAIIRGSPHADAAQQLFDYLQSPQVVSRLIAANALEGLARNQEQPPTMTVDWPGLLRDLESTTAKLNQIFLR